MYEEKTFENILSDMLSYVSTISPDLDIREGSIIYTTLAPVAIELETAYREANMIMEETFLLTASKEGLVNIGNQLGVKLNEATYGEFKGYFNVQIPLNSRFNLDKFNYSVVEELNQDSNGDYWYRLVCETSGSTPNAYTGELTPITSVSGFEYGFITEVLIPGEDEEDTEAYRYRIQTHAQKPPVNGNVSYYNELLDGYDGIGRYAVIPLWNGANSVKLVVLNAENEPINDQDTLAEIQEYFDPIESQGMGDGQAPIGAVVTVVTAEEVKVDITADLTLKSGYSSPVGVEESIQKYLESIAFVKNSVQYLPISAAIYNAESVDSVNSLSVTVKNTTMDIEATEFVSSVSLDTDEIAILDRDSFNLTVGGT